MSINPMHPRRSKTKWGVMKISFLHLNMKECKTCRVVLHMWTILAFGNPYAFLKFEPEDKVTI